MDMPPTGAESKVQDQKYKNWLKAGLALYYLKVGLCSFIEREVVNMHQSLREKLYQGPHLPASQCCSCSSKDVKQDRHSLTWKFRSTCPNNLCDTWLKELLTLHKSPTSNRIFFENCDVAAWPIRPWECAKLYMPQGQPPTNTCPAESDCVALLSLMSSCKYFKGKLSERGLQLTQNVSKRRNIVMHSSDMTLSDSDRTNFIRDIITLLEDPIYLKALEGCKQAVAEINKLNTDSLDVVFSIDLEMKALHEHVNTFRQELGVHEEKTEKTVDSLKKEFKSLKVQFDYIKKETKDKFGDLDTKYQKMETTITRLESGHFDRLSRMDKLEGTECILEKMSRIETRMTGIENQNVNRTKLNQRIGLMRGRIERHKSDNMDVHIRTKVFDYARDILYEHKHLVLQGKPGEGKTYLALSLVADLIEKDKELQPVDLHNANEWEEIVDTKRPLVVFLDDVLGKYGHSEIDIDRWRKISEIIYPNLISGSVFIIVCIRTQIALSIKFSHLTNKAFSLMFDSHVVDISSEQHCLTKEERMQMLIKYAPQCVDTNKTSTMQDILELKNFIGFPQNCKIIRCRQHVTLDLKEVFSNNRFLVEEVQELSNTNPKIYAFLVLLMLSGGHLSLENKIEEINEKIRTISDYCGLKKQMNIGQIKYIGHSLCGTFVEYNKDTRKFNFQHDCIETALFISFGKNYAEVTLRLCSLKQLSKMCCVAKEFDQSETEDLLNFKITIDDAHFGIVCERFNKGLESGERESFKSIAEALVWKSLRFVGYFSKTITSVDAVLYVLSKTDSDGHSLLIHLIYARNHIVVERIIRTISQCCVRDHILVERQFLLATTNACLAEEKDLLVNLIEFGGKVNDFVMFAAALTGNVSIMEILIRQNGNINATLSIDNGTCIANTIKNCIYYPKTSSYHHDVNLFHIACSCGREAMVKYLITRYPDLVNRSSSSGWTALHFVAVSENVELMKLLSSEIDITGSNTVDGTLLHISASSANIIMTNYLIKTFPQLIRTIDNNGYTVAHSAALGGGVHVMQALLEAGLDITARANYDRHVLHIAAMNDHVSMVKYLIKSNPPLIQELDTNGWAAVHYAAVRGSVTMMKALTEVGLDITVRTNEQDNILHIAASYDNLTIVKYMMETNPLLLQQTNKNGMTAVHYAAAGGSVCMMETLIEAGLDITAKTKDGFHVMHIAAGNDNLAIVNYLIETNRQFLQETNKNGWTTLHCASAGGSVRMMEALTDAGLDITVKTDHCAHVLHIAAGNANMAIVKYLIETNPLLLQQTSSDGWTSLHCAAAGGTVSVIEILKEAGLDITVRTNNGSNLLHIAAINDNMRIVKYLIDTSSQLLQETNNTGCTAIHYAAAKGSVPVIEVLMEAGLDITARTCEGAGVLHIAAIHDNLTIVRYLIKNRAQLLQQADNNGLTAAHYAAARGGIQIMEALNEAGLNIAARTNDGTHILHIASGNDNLAIVQYCIKTNPRLLEQSDTNGWTPLHHAAASGSVPVIETLIEARLDITARTNNGSDVLEIAAKCENITIVKYLLKTNPQLLQHCNENGRTSIHYVAARGSVSVMKAFIEAGVKITERTNNDANVIDTAVVNENIPVVKYLLESNRRLLEQNNENGWTVVHDAVARGTVPVIKALVDAGLDITARNNEGAHLLHIAASIDNLELVKYLIQTNLQLFQQSDTNGSTPLHYAATGGSVSVMETLIKAGLDITALTNEGAHVLEIAARNENIAIIKYLLTTNFELLKLPNKSGWTTLQIAAARGSVRVMEAFIEAGLDITALINTGDPVLKFAVQNENIPVVKYMLETNPQLLEPTNKCRWTVVHDAAANGTVPVIKVLVDAGLDITARNNEGAHLLHIAASIDNLELVKYLIQTNLQLFQQFDTSGSTPLHYAAAGGSVSVMETLIKAGLDITALTNEGVHVLEIAMWKENIAIIKYLLTINFGLLKLPNKSGRTTLQIAAARGSVRVMEAFIEAGLDIVALINTGDPVLKFAVQNENIPVVKYMLETNPQLLEPTNECGWTMVHDAAAKGTVHVIKVLVDAGLDITARDNKGANLLHIAASIDNLELVKYLIQTNLQLFQQSDTSGSTPLHYAAAGGSVSVMETLIKAGLDITALTNEGVHVLEIAMWKENIAIIKYLLTINFGLLKLPNKSGWTTLHMAAARGSVRVMEAFIEAGLDITALINTGDPVLEFAVDNENIPVVKYMLETNPQLLEPKNECGWTMVHDAAAKGTVPVIKVLVDAGLDITARDNKGAHLLHIAASIDNLELVKYLIQTNLQLFQQSDTSGSTPLHYAAAGGSVSVMETLIKAGLDITALTNEGVHVLEIATWNENIAIIKYLLTINFGLLKLPNKSGRTTLQIAAARGSVRVMEAFIEAGLDIVALINTGDPVLKIAVQNENIPVVKYMLETNPQLLEPTNECGWTMVHDAAAKGTVHVIKALVDAGLDITARDNKGANLLHIAASIDNLELVKYLIQTNLQLFQQLDTNGSTPLHYAAAGGSVSIMETLIKAGLDITALTCKGAHVLEIAARNENIPIIKYLLTINFGLLKLPNKLGWTTLQIAAARGSVRVMEAFIEAGLDIVALINTGDPVHEFAVENENIPVVKYMLETNPQLLGPTNECGWTMVHDAAAKGTVPVIKVLVDAGLDITARNNEGAHLLHIAASIDNLELVKYLIQTNLQLFQQLDTSGSTPLHYAAAGGSVSVMETLIKAGLDITALTNEGVHALEIATWNENIAIIKYLLTINFGLLKLPNKSGRTTLQIAAARGSVRVMEAFIEAGLDITALINTGDPVLKIAVQNENIPVVKYMLETNPQLLEPTNECGWTMVHDAAAKGTVHVIKVLVDAGLDITARNNEGAHLLHIAASIDNLELVKYLIQTNLQLFQQLDTSGSTPLHYAATGGSVSVMETLIKAGLDITALTNEGVHALEIATWNENIAIIKYLLTINFGLLKLPNKSGRTTLQIAAARGSVRVMEAFIEAGLDIAALINTGDPVLKIAVQNGNIPVVKYMLETNPQLLEPTNECGWTMVHDAAAKGTVPVIKVLVDAGLDITARNNNGSQLLHIAAKADNLELVKYMIQKHSQLLEQSDTNGRTPLHYAAAGGSVPVMQALLEAGLNIKAMTYNDCDVLHIARSYDNRKIVKYLHQTNTHL